MSWVPSSRAAELADPVALTIWAEQGQMRSRAAHMRRDGEPDKTPDFPAIPADFWHWVRWGSRSLALWREGLFEANVRDDDARWQMSGVTFHEGDLAVLTGAHGPMRGTLPTSATPNDRKYEEAAHAAAVIIRAEGIPRSKAFRRVLNLVDGLSGSDDSMCRAIRLAYAKMYEPNGHPKISETLPRQPTTSA